MIDFDTPSRRMVAEHARGDSYRAIGQRHGVSHEAARQTVLREARKWIDSVEMDLLVARKIERMGREAEAEWPTLLVPHGEDWSTGLSLLQWMLDRLRARDLDVTVRNRPLPNGAAFMLTTPGGAAS